MLLFAMLPLLSACTREAPVAIVAEAGTSEIIPTVVTVRWTTDDPVAGYVSFGVAGEKSYETPLEEEATTDHEALLLGMPPDSDVDFQVFTDGDDALQSDVQTVRTGFLTNELPSVSAEGDGQDRFTVTTLINTSGAMGPAILDEKGRIVWFYSDAAGKAGYTGLWTYRARLSQDGKGLIYNTGFVSYQESEASTIVRVSFDGSEVETTPVPYISHDFTEMADGSSIAIVKLMKDDVQGDEIVEVGTDGAITPLWDSWDCFDPDDLGDPDQPGWTWANALKVDLEEDAWYLGMRNFSSIARIDAGTGSCDWVFGHYGATFSPPKDAPHFGFQHNFLIEGDEITIFDNAGSSEWNEGGREVGSRVLKYRIDPEKGVATSLWSFHPDPPVNSLELGDVHRVENGDLIVNYGAAGQIDRLGADDDAVLWRVNASMGGAFGYSSQETELYAGPSE
jgi:hypothetical protein